MSMSHLMRLPERYESVKHSFKLAARFFMESDYVKRAHLSDFQIICKAGAGKMSLEGFETWLATLGLSS